MNTIEFYSIPDTRNTRHTLIIHENSEIRVSVIPMEVTSPYFKAREMHLFGDDHGDYLAFETIGYKTDNNYQTFLSAIRWYSRYLDYPEMEVVEEDPRP